MNRREVLALLGGAGAGLAAGADDLRAGGHANGAAAGATPMSGPHAYFCGIHIAKGDPKFQLIVQHYCAAHNGEGEDAIFQCLLFDSRDANAKLLGVEYIVSDRQYRALPDDEKRYWHPHTYEVLAGGLIAPEMTEADETAFLKTILTTWGKTWHTWPDPKTPVPMGEPLLMWSVTADGQLDDRVVAERDRTFRVSTDEIRRKRRQSMGYDVPKVSLPRSMDQVGRQWTDDGEDAPTKAP